MDYSFQKMENTEAVFYGRLTNETRTLSKAECDKKGIFHLSYLFPWENIKEEWTTVQGKQFEYADLELANKNAETKKSINLD